MNDLPLHITNEEDYSDGIDIDLEIMDDLMLDNLALKEEIDERLSNYKTGLESLFALEEYHGTIYGKETFDGRDIKQLNIIANAINTNLVSNYNGFSIATEGLTDLVKAAGANVKNAVATTVTAANAANLIGKTAAGAVNGVIKATELSKILVDKINQGIINLGSEYEIIAKLVEKRWFGIKSLIEVYNLHVSKLEDRITDATKDSSSLRADIKVKLNTAKLSNNRKVNNKNDYMRIIREDLTAVIDFLNNYTESIKITDTMSKDTIKSIAFMAPYKQTMIRNLNMFNFDVLEKLGKMDLFNGGFEEGNETHSRVLIGGKRVSISYLRNRASTEDTRKDLRVMIREMNIYGSRAKGNDNVNVNVVTLRDFRLADAKELISLLRATGEALSRYNGESIPQLIKDRSFFSRITEVVTGLATAVTGFGITKNFLANGNNLDLVKQSMPVKLLNVVDLFVKAASLTALVTLVGAKTAGLLVDWLRKYIISSVFTSMDLQYRITRILNSVDSSVIDTMISVRSQCYRVTDKLSKAKVWV